MTKEQAVAHIKALYAVFNAADSDNRASWTNPQMAATCCKPLDTILRQLFTQKELDELYANGEIG
jgi:hypothetical protein